ncbi:MAG: cupin domain-containing protein [Bradyrhizobium sp.]|jgi:quercetin dioxygenase-like cupin family protein
MRHLLWITVAIIVLPLFEFASAHAAGVHCRPISERIGNDPGCWIIADQPVGNLTKPQTFWYLDAYPTRVLAEAAKGAHGAVVESLGKQWLLSIEDDGWRAPAGGERIAQIGPLPVTAGEAYTAQYMEAVFNPGMTAPTHVHSGPEAWYTLTGETCLETPDGVQIGRAGGQYVIVPGGLPMHLTATGKEQRQALVLILHDSTKPASTLVSYWTPKGLCKN